MFDLITPVILTFNEEANIGRCLERLDWAKNVIILDSYSSDKTVEICKMFCNVVVLQREFDNHSNQWTHAVFKSGIVTEWVLALDADYILTDEFIEELSTIVADGSIAGYRCRFQYWNKGQMLRCALYPPVIALYRRKCARYIQDGHTQVVKIDGQVSQLQSFIRHDDRKPLTRWIQSQIYYTPLEAEKISNTDWPNRQLKHILRSWIPISPIVVTLYILIVRGGILDGVSGLHYCFQRIIAECLICLHYFDKRLSPPGE